MSTADAPSPDDVALREAIRACLVAALERHDAPPDGFSAAHLDRMVEDLAAMTTDPERRIAAVAIGSEVLASFMLRTRFAGATAEALRPARDAGALLAWALASLADHDEPVRLRAERAQLINANTEVARLNVDLQFELGALRAQLATLAPPGDAP